MHYRATLGPEHRIRVYVVDDDKIADLRALVETRGKLFARGAGVSIYRCEWDADPLTAIYRIVVWEKIVLHAAVLGNGLALPESGEAAGS